MRRRKADEAVERLSRDHFDQLKTLARKAARWATDNFAALADAHPEVPEELHDRAADNWCPLLAIADQAGGDWRARAQWAALQLSLGDAAEDKSVGVQLLADIRTKFEEQGSDRLASAVLCKSLADMEDRPWPEWRHGKPITPRQLAGLLGPFGIKPKMLRFEPRTQRGYLLADFEDAFARYLAPQNVTP